MVYLANGHGAENVEEDEGAVGKVGAGEVPMGQALDEADRREWQLGNHSSVEAV